MDIFDPSVNPSAAAEHIRLLTGSPNTEVWFRFYDDNKDRKDAALAGTLYGTVAECWAEIERRQRLGCAVCVVVNEGGNKAAEITRIRANFVDADGLPIPSAWHLDPDFLVIRDATHWHAYWSVEDMPVAGFKVAQQRLAAHYGTDQVDDLPRVLRLAGTLHLKDPNHPRLVTLEPPAEEYGPATAAEILAGLPEIVEPERQLTTDRQPLSTDAGDALAALAAIPNDDVEWKEWNDTGLCLYDATQGSEAGYRAFVAWSTKSAKFKAGDCTERWRHYKGHPYTEKNGLASLIARARAADPDWLSPSAQATKRKYDAIFGQPDLTPDDGDREDDGGPRTINTAEKYDDHRVTAGWSSYGDEEAEDTPTPELVPRWIEKGVTGYAEGGGGLGKSYIATQDGLCLAAGHDVLGEQVERTGCLYLNYEEPKQEFDRRVAKIRRRLGEDGKLLDARGFLVRHLRDEPAAHILRVKKDGGFIITRFGRTFLVDLANRRDRGVDTFVVFDGIMDAILFEGSTRMDDGVARQVIALLDRWCVEYDFTAQAILHPSRAGERLGGGSYAPAWSTKPRVIQTYSAVTFDGKPVGNRKDIPAAHLFTRRFVEKRSHGKKGYWVDVQYVDGIFRPIVSGQVRGGEDPVDVAVDLACKQARLGDRIKQDGKLGPNGATLSNRHGIIIEYRQRTGQSIGADHFLGSLKEALAAGKIAYQSNVNGSSGRVRAGYYPIDGWEPAKQVYEAWQDTVTMQ